MAPTLADLEAQREKMLADGATFADLAQLNARIRDLAMGAGPDEPEPEVADDSDAAYMHLPPATTEQAQYARTLIEGFRHMAENEEDYRATMTWAGDAARREVEMNGVITELLVMADENRAVRTLDDAPTLPTGRYLLDGELWDVSRVTVGARTGVALRPLADDGVTTGPAVSYRAKKREIIAALTADPVTAARAYAKKFGTCGLCTEELTGVAATYLIHAGCLLAA